MPRYQAVLFDFFGTLTRSVQRGSAHRATAELLGCPEDTLTAVLDRSFYQRASGEYGTAESTLRWVCTKGRRAPLRRRGTRGGRSPAAGRPRRHPATRRSGARAHGAAPRRGAYRSGQRLHPRTAGRPAAVGGRPAARRAGLLRTDGQ